MALKLSTCVERKYDSPTGLNAFRLIFQRLSSLNAALKWRLWCCCYRQNEATSRRKGTFARTSAVPRTIADHENLGSRMETPIIDTDGEEETGTFRMRTDHWLAAAWTWNWRLLSILSRSVQSVSSFRHHALCIVDKTFQIYKITKQIAGSRKIQTNKQTTTAKVCAYSRNSTLVGKK